MTVVRHSTGHIEHRLRSDIELRGQCQFVAYFHPDALAKVSERFGDGQRCRRQHASGNALEQSLTQESRDIHRTSFHKDAASAPFDPRNIILQITVAKHFEFALDLSGAAPKSLPVSG